jgi:hypothetical protein
MSDFMTGRVHRKYVTQEILVEYGLTDEYYDSHGYVYLEIRKGMYGLKEASILAYDQLKAHLNQYGYSPVRFTPGLWKHNMHRTTFTLAVDDFGIKYFNKAVLIIFLLLSTTNMHSPKIGPVRVISDSL